MFKLESYITPWLLSYIDQYVKLRREDFQLSLWGGDVVLNNLELRLANIQKLVPNLPIIFQSGLIHELRIHIPWIRINSEPIVVTLNQIELVIVLNKERMPANDSPTPFQNDIPTDPVLMQQQQPTTAEQSNYVQTVLARILNNVQIVVNNLIIKFVEDDVVISLSSRTAQCFAVNQQWLKSFVELTQQDLSLRRLITLPDLTLCLDRRDFNGKVHRYEVPLLSRCSFECRIQMFYANVNQQLNTKPIQTRLTFNCANIEVSIVDNQLSMIRRLTESIMSVIHAQIPTEDQPNGNEQTTTVTNGSPSKTAVAPPPPPARPPSPLPALPPVPAVSSTEEQPTAGDDPQQPGWVSWAWSYVPSVTTLFVEDDLPPEANDSTVPLEQSVKEESLPEEQTLLIANQNSHQSPTPILFAGIDLDRISLQYKVTNLHREKTSLVPFIGFIVEKANIIVERYKPTSTTADDGQSVVTRVRKVKVSTSRMSLLWDERLCLSSSDIQFTLHYDRHVLMTRLSLMVTDFNVRLKNDLLIYPFQATLKLDHLRTYSLLHLDLSSLTGQLDFDTLAYLIAVVHQIESIVDTTSLIFRPAKPVEPLIEPDLIFVDDLRNGSMKCLFQTSNDLPNANEIVFTSTTNHNLASSMTWKYPQRRSILKCHILPLPFVDDAPGAVMWHRIKTVECLMQYWHFGTKQFVTWQTFELSDSQPLFLDFSNDLAQNPYSEMWRIVLVNASLIINEANTLAASTRIDSLQSERYEPSIEMGITIPNIRVHFMINPQKEHSVSKFESILNGCKHDALTLNLDNISFDLSQRLETRLISLETLLSLEALEYRFLTKRACIEPALINMDLLIDTSKSSLSTPSADIFNTHNDKYNQLFRSAKTSIVLQLHFDIDHINIRLSQSLCHLINILHQHYMHSNMIDVLQLKPTTQQVLSLIHTDHLFYYTYYLFTNHLNCPIGLKQYNTTDNFHILASNRTMDFVWSKLNNEQTLLQFALENFSNDPFYSSAIDIHPTDHQQKLTVQFDNSPHVFYLQIYYDEHHIRRHLHLIGQLIVKNLSNVDLNVKLNLHVGSRSMDLSLSKDQSYISCLQSIDDIQSIQWNASKVYSLDQFNAEGIISTSEQTSLWIHLFHSEQLTCLIFAPIVIYRSYLTQAVQLHLNTDRSCLLQSNGSYTYFHDLHFDQTHRKYQHRLQQVEADQFTDSIFELHQQSHLTVTPNNSHEPEKQTLIAYLLQLEVPSPPTANADRSPSQILDLLRQEHRKHKQTEEDFPVPLIEQSNEILNATLIPTIGANGPAMYEPSLPVPTKKTNPFVASTQLTTNSIDCRIEPIRLYAHLNTILIQLKPLTLIDNRTPFHFHLYANAGHDHVYIHAEELTCLSKLGYSQLQFMLIDPHDGEHIQCQTIDLVLRSIPMISSASMINNRLFSDGHVDLYFIKSSNNDYFLFRLRHEYLDHTHILTIQSKFFFNNQTDQSLMCSVLPISKQQYAIDHPYHCLPIPSGEKCPIYRFQGVPSTDISYYLLFQRTAQDKYAAVNIVSKPIQLLPMMDESVNRQCFCLFQKDHLLRSESTKPNFDSSYPSLRGDLFSVNQSIRVSTSQLEICIQSNPSWAFLQLVNTCPCSLLCRLENISSFSHIIPPYSSAFVGIDSSELSPMNNTNSANHYHLENLMNGSRFYLAQFPAQESNDLFQTMTNYFQHLTTKTVQWSRPVKIDTQLEDVFLPVPGLHDVLIRSMPVSLAASRTLVIEPVHRQKPTKTTVTPKSSTPNQTNSSPSATTITETVPRHYRSLMLEKAPSSTTSNASTQFFKAWQQQYSQGNHRQIQMNFLVNKISFSLMDELSDISSFPEIIRLTIDKLNVLYYQRLIDLEPVLSQKQFFCSMDQLQIDNQCYSPKQNFDFPVVLMSKDEKRVSKVKTNVYEKKERNEAASSSASSLQHRRQNSSSSIDTTMTEETLPSFDSLSHNHRTSRSSKVKTDQPRFLNVHFHRINERFIKIDFHVQSFDVYLEDRYIYILLKTFSEFLPLNLLVPNNSKEREQQIETIENQLLNTPFVCESLVIGPIDIVVSLHASMKVYIGCHQLPVFVDKFQRNHIYSTNKQLMTLITRHYLVSLLTRSPMLLGSFDLLGNPSALIRNVTDGVYDLFHLPYIGMRNGPSGFMLGISEGATSLLKHLSLGTLTSLTTFANSVARNMDRLAMDSEHSTRNEETCRQIPMGMTSGLLQGLELFSLSILGAIAGLAEQPLASFRNRNDSQAATTTVLSGVGKGLVGVVVKPVSGVAQLISQTGQGILYGTGLMNIPHRRHRQIEQDARINTTSSYLKLALCCQIADDQDEIVDTLEYVLEHHCIEHGIFILTKNGRFLVYHKDDENQHGNYILHHIELSESPESTALLLFNNLSFYVDSRLRQQFLALCRFIRQ